MKSVELPVLTIHQPAAGCIFMDGELRKDVENRTWAPDLPVPFPLLIHASSCPLEPEFKAFIEEWRAEEPEGDWVVFTPSAIIGIVVVQAITTPERLRSECATGPVCWVLSRPVAFAQPIPAKGRQKLWWASVPLKLLSRDYQKLALKLDVNRPRN
jgi:hypothetical protein